MTGFCSVGGNPVEKIDGLVVRVIPSLDLLLVEAEHVLAEIEVARQQSEFFERRGRSDRNVRRFPCSFRRASMYLATSSRVASFLTG